MAARAEICRQALISGAQSRAVRSVALEHGDPQRQARDVLLTAQQDLDGPWLPVLQGIHRPGVLVQEPHAVNLGLATPPPPKTIRVQRGDMGGLLLALAVERDGAVRWSVHHDAT